MTKRDALGRELFDNPFETKQAVTGQTSKFFASSLHNWHIETVKRSNIGKTVVDIVGGDKIKIENNYLINGAIYHHTTGMRTLGHIEIGRMANALLIGHELRHAWQFMTLPGHVLSPNSPEEQVLLDHFIEADGRAFEFGLTIQIVNDMGVFKTANGEYYGNEYAHNLLACLDPYEKEVLEYSLTTLKDICDSPAKFKQAMRQVFDLWITIVPVAPEAYKAETEKHLQAAERSIVTKLFNRIIRGGLSGKPNYVSSGIRPQYVQSLIESLGQLGDSMPGNYLTETTGLDFTSEFYSRICDFRLENSVGAANQRLHLTR